jgi:beta-glucanase (GH16 family)
MEGQGSTASQPLSGNDFYGTIHRNSCNCYQQPTQQNANNWHRQPFKLANNWHTYAALWDDTTVKWYLNGVFSHQTPVYDSFNQTMFVILSMWPGGWVSDTTAATPDELHVEFDWVRVWQN